MREWKRTRGRLRNDWERKLRPLRKPKVDDYVVSRGPDTPSQSKGDACAADREKKSVTPVKSKLGANANKISCAVCLGDIVDGKHEAIFCDGKCKRWYHRGCASVSQELLSTLTASDEPFFCLMCS